MFCRDEAHIAFTGCMPAKKLFSRDVAHIQKDICTCESMHGSYEELGEIIVFGPIGDRDSQCNAFQ